MENPLTAWLCASVFLLMIRGSRPSAIAALAALLVATRPDLAPIALALPALAVWRRGWSWRSAATSYAVFAFAVVCLFLPMYKVSGQIFPSAFGARVPAVIEMSPVTLVKQLARSVLHSPFWISSWALLTLILAALSIAIRRRPGSTPIVALAMVLTVSLIARAALGLTDFNVEDRYISYVWPLLAIGFAQLIVRSLALSERVVVRLTMGVVLISVISISAAARAFVADVQEMNDVAVAPAQWLATTLPTASRVGIEQAGAIRLFTDVTLVDRTGLTTPHKEPEAGALHAFATTHRLDYVCDYPDDWPELHDPLQFAILHTWSARQQRHGLGRIGMFRVIPGPAITSPR
jgi:hypothetical protein